MLAPEHQCLSDLLLGPLYLMFCHASRCPSSVQIAFFYKGLTPVLNSQGITIADPNLPDCPLMYVNEAFCRMTGYDQDEILGRNCRFLQGPETDKAALARIKIAMQQV